MEDENFLEFGDVLHLAWSRAKHMSDIGSQVETALAGANSCRGRVEAILLRNYLQMCPLAASREVVNLPHGRVMIFDMYYDANKVFKILE